MSFLPSFYTVLVAFAPLPFPFLDALREIEVTTSTEQAGTFTLRFDLSQTALGDWDVLQVDIFRPLVPIQVRVHLGLGLSEALINGYVHSARLQNSNTPGGSTLEVTGMDATATLMNLFEQPFPWPNLPDNVIATTIFGKYLITPLVFPTPSLRTILQTTTIQRTSDIRFLRQLARRYGYECFVQPDPLIGVDVGHFHPPQIIAPPQGVLSINFGAATNLTSFDVRYDMLQPTTALAAAIDPTTRAPLPAIALTSIEPPMGLEPALLRVLPPPISRPTDTDAANAPELLATAQSIVNRSSRAIRATGEIDGGMFERVLRPGLPVLVRGAGREHSGLFYVSQVTHTISADRYAQRFEAWRNAVTLTGAEPFVDPLAALS
jgi:hypothetical protein